MNLINIFSKSMVPAHDLELINYFLNDFQIKIVYYFFCKKTNIKEIHTYCKNNNVELLFNLNEWIKLSGTTIFLDFIPSDKLIDKLDINTRLIFIWNIFMSTWINNNIRKLDTFNFYRQDFVKKEFKTKFPNTQINNIYNINYPSWIRGIDDFKKQYSKEYLINLCKIYYQFSISKLDIDNDEYLYDIVFILWGWLNFKIINKIIKNYKNKRILVIWKNHEHIDVQSNMDLIKEFEEYGNVNVIDMVEIKELYVLLKLSKIGILPFNVNIKRDITRIADLLFLWKILLTTKIDANKDIRNLIFCNDIEDFYKKINYYLDKNRYNNEYNYNKTKKYYNDNFRIKLILSKIFKKDE